jgi:hypothetical protein
MMPAMSNLDREAFEAVRALVAALGAARAEMRRAEQSLERALERARGNESLDSFMVVTQPARKRQSLIEALEHVNRCRHETRLRVFALALDRGYSVSDIARAWGISRQLASRYVREALGTDDGDAPDSSKEGEGAAATPG